ncbi:NADH-quinone oxidoreductase subunit J [Candidatus Sumerlaeota bacterium]
MEAQIQAIIFYALSAMTVLTAALAVFQRNIFKSACSLFFTFLGLAGLFALLGADFLAVTQVVVYVGGILTLILFGVLLTSPVTIELKLNPRLTFPIAIFGGLLIFCMLMGVVFFTDWPVVAPAEVIAQNTPTTRDIGHLLLGRYLLPFEVSSITLLIALVGAAYMVRREGSDDQ